MKLVYFILFLLLVGTVSAQVDHWIIIDDDATQREVGFARQVEERVETQLNLSFTIKFERQVDFVDRAERITIDINRNEATVFIGKESGFDDDTADDISKAIAGEILVTEEPEELPAVEEPEVEVVQVLPPIELVEEVCEGCQVGDDCIEVGARIDATYCAPDGNIQDQKDAKEQCQADYECAINKCKDNQCKKQGFFSRIVQWFKDLF